MTHGNIFTKGIAGQYASIIYEQFMSHKWISYKTVVHEYYKNCPDKEPSQVTSTDYYTELKKAFMYVRRAIVQVMGDSAIIAKGKTRDKEFKYVGKDKDPLKKTTSEAIVSRMEDYLSFCQASSGMMPIEWIRHFFCNTYDLLDIEHRRNIGTQVIASEERTLKNIEMLPTLYERIKERVAIKIIYRGFGRNPETLIMHPHFLKEYNGRWFLFGHVNGKSPEFGYNVPLDRIEDLDNSNERYIPAPDGFYKNYFNEMVGVSHENQPVETVVLRVYGDYMWGLVNTKYFHPTQIVRKEYASDGAANGYGEIELRVIPNKELIGRILQYGPDIEVISPASFRERTIHRIDEIKSRY